MFQKITIIGIHSGIILSIFRYNRDNDLFFIISDILIVILVSVSFTYIVSSGIVKFIQKYRRHPLEEHTRRVGRGFGEAYRRNQERLRL